MKTTFAIFSDSKAAGDAVSQLKQSDFVKDVSLVAKDEQGQSEHQIKEDVSDGTTAGAVVGGTIGGIAGLLAGLSSIVVPGIGPLIVAGPLTLLWGLGGGAIGALTGGLTGALVDAGITEDRARSFEEAVARGEVLVAATSDEESVDDVQAVMREHGAGDTVSVDKEKTE